MSGEPVPAGSVAAVQAAYYAASGALPLLSRRAFEALTGRKREWWLVQTIALLLLVVSAVLASAARRERVTGEVACLGAGTAGAFAAIDVVHAGRGRIAPVYLVDALLQLGLIGGWLRTMRR